ncbi:unnamed protein product [Cladocopium goreaui]|uniref:F-box domain-containing protein n=1 Tax=Cladocopium goreaui TaxID=2562237 RepID=A0A9P1C3H6_9DINO|nr:unnamed protein product [Cladocopium goreaui]
MSIREHALMLWIIEGSDFLRFHEGDCYMLHPCGAFQRYKGVPPDSSRISSLLLELEGMFRRFPEDSPRDHERLLQVINQQWQEAGENEELLKTRCIKAAVSNVGESLVKQRGGDDADMDGDVKNWRVYAARVVLQLKVRLARELTEEKLLHYMVEWCETPKRTASACCFEHCCVEYCDEGVARQVARANIKDVYTFIPHKLKGVVQPDIVERLQKFYRQMFWCNLPIFKCCQAAQALAKRGYNVVRIFIGLSSGGAMYGANFAYFDPNIGWNEDEMRKQIEQLNGCFVLTGQEAPGTNKRLREDLYKKFMGAEGISGRKPYGLRPSSWAAAFSCLLARLTLVRIWAGSGVSDADVRRWTEVATVSHEVQTQAGWLWEILEESDEAYRAKVLKFTTGVHRIGYVGIQSFEAR